MGRTVNSPNAGANDFTCRDGKHFPVAKTRRILSAEKAAGNAFPPGGVRPADANRRRTQGWGFLWRARVARRAVGAIRTRKPMPLMKTIPSFQLRPAGIVVAMACALALTLPPLRAADESKPATGTVLQVRVEIPPTPRPNMEQRVGDRFVDEMADVFRNLGFEGKVERLDSLDKPKEGAPQLLIRLFDWERGPTGNIECRFAASLQVNGTKRDLGSFTNTAPSTLTMPGRFGVARAFDDAAEGALRQLYEAIAKTELVPGLRQR
jgi:hypothetical protein